MQSKQGMCILLIIPEHKLSVYFQTCVLVRVVKVFAMGVITRDFAMFLPAGKNTFGHGNKWQKLNFGNGWVLSAVF